MLYKPDASKKELVVGKVLQNLRDSKAVVLQPYAGVRLRSTVLEGLM